MTIPGFTSKIRYCAKPIVVTLYEFDGWWAVWVNTNFILACRSYLEALSIFYTHKDHGYPVFLVEGRTE